MGTIAQSLSAAFGTGGVTAFTIDAITDFVAMRVLALTTDPIVKVEWFCNTKTGTPGSLKIVLTADIEGIPNISAGVPVDIGGGSPTLVTLSAAAITSGARHTTTLTNAYTPTAGEYIWIVLYPDSAGSYDASNRYQIRYQFIGHGIDHGDEIGASSIDTGTSWTRLRTGCVYVSLLTTADAYLTTIAACCVDSAASDGVWDDADTPDERGTAWTIPASTAAKVYGVRSLMRPTALTADFELACYLDDTLQGSRRTVDTSKVEVTATTNLLGTLWLPSPPVTVSSAGTGRVTMRATHATATIRQAVVEFGSQARRESCIAFRDMWYCNRDGGAGAFTDDKTRLYSIIPIVEHYGAGGGGDIVIPCHQTNIIGGRVGVAAY